MAKRNQQQQEQASKVKKLNIYKVVTTIGQPGGNEPLPVNHTDYVRAKTLAGAKALIAKRYIDARLATPDDLLELAQVAVIGAPAGA